MYPSKKIPSIGQMNRKLFLVSNEQASDGAGGYSSPTQTSVRELWVYASQVKGYEKSEAKKTEREETWRFVGRYSEVEFEIGNTLSFSGKELRIHSVEVLDHKNKFVEIIAIATGGTSSFSEGGSSGGTSTVNWESFTYDQLTGVLTYAGTADSDYTQTNFWYNPDTGATYQNAEGDPVSVGNVLGLTIDVPYFTPGEVLVKWRRVSPPQAYTPLTDYDEQVLTITRLARRWLRVWRTGSFDLSPGFNPVNLYNINDQVIGLVSDIDELVSTWNAAPANVNFQIINYRTTNGYYEVQIEPNISEVLYPISFVHYEFP